MKSIFIPAKTKLKINEKKISQLKLPKKIAIAYSIQFKEIAEKVSKILSVKHKITLMVQVLGCSSPKFPSETEAILLLSTGKFHAVSLAFESGIPVYVLEENNIKQISKEEIDLLDKKRKTSYLKFLNADKIGILVSTKPGQENLEKAISFKSKLKNKKSYLFIGNNIDINEFENFGINSWVNTACPRMDFDTSVINLKTLNSR
ncbi:2-(3-amino-3-carboxypropyl)histidine synthase [uncultured archaeon]|nr:2-(3-amino-3-carboxypropyl)histidine synthase [uncultured archaeon]